MAKIFEMSSHLADLIAAGEVVERPGSVVKELVENSIDAGASVITAEIRNGGMSFIRVTDNGCGIAPEDTEKAFLRHATSKLLDESGLESISTLGFRGEALAAVSAVSRTEMLTREKGADEGTRLVLEGGLVKRKEVAGCPDGTTIFVRDLFFNTPARFKYMKNDRTEGSNVTAVVIRLALSHPEISFRYIRDGREELHTSGDGKMDSCIYDVLGRDFSMSLLRAETELDGVSVEGYVSTPAGCRGNRNSQYFFLNGRFIRSKTIQTALEQAYKNSLFTGRFPACVLNIRLNTSSVDVNVHPTKTEVRFSSEKQVFDAVYWAAKGALEMEGISGEQLSMPEESASGDSKDEMETAERDFFPDAVSRRNDYPSAPDRTGAVYRAEPRKDFFKRTDAEAFRAGRPSGSDIRINKAPDDIARENFRVDENTGEVIEISSSRQDIIPDTEREIPEQSAGSAGTWRYVGEVLKTYLVAEKDDSVYFIDKHAAHERMLFDRLKEGNGRFYGQVLLAPQVCGVGAEAAEVIGENTELLSEFGIDAENFGGGSVLVRQVPLGMDTGDLTAFMEEIAEKISTGGRREMESIRDDIMHSVACRAAIKAGTESEPDSVTFLIDRVMDGTIKYCPHGRPVALEMSKRELDKKFKRT